MDWNQRKIVIVGGTSGIGLATAKLLLSRGAEVYVTGREADKAAELEQKVPGLHAAAVDASSGKDLRVYFEQLGRFTDLVLCASGAKGAGPFSTLKAADVLTGFQEKFVPQFLSAQTALPHLAEDGSITFVSAASARASSPGTSGLAAINGAIEAMTRPMARELKPLRINCVSPGVVETTWWDRIPEPTRSELLHKSADATLVGRNAQPEELADAIAFLIGNGFVSGTVLEVDGGMRLL